MGDPAVHKEPPAVPEQHQSGHAADGESGHSDRRSLHSVGIDGEAAPIAGAAIAPAILPLLAACHAMPSSVSIVPGPATWPQTPRKQDRDRFQLHLRTTAIADEVVELVLNEGPGWNRNQVADRNRCGHLREDGISAMNRLAGNRTGQHQREASSRRNGDDRRSPRDLSTAVRVRRRIGAVFGP
jgi:hypothetical protein